MKLSTRTIEQLSILINSDDNDEHYRKGSELVHFFNDLGFQDKYGRGFPARKTYTLEKLNIINDSELMKKCLEKTFSVEDYIEDVEYLDSIIQKFNKYLKFDFYEVKRENNKILIHDLNKIIIPNTSESCDGEELENIDVENLRIEDDVKKIILSRLEEVKKCIAVNASLSSIILMGSILEGILFGVSQKNIKIFNQSEKSPKVKGKVKKFNEWTFENYLNVALDVGVIKEDASKFSCGLREFRNYVHPYRQLHEKFNPSKETALICYKVLGLAINQIIDYQNSK